MQKACSIAFTFCSAESKEAKDRVSRFVYDCLDVYKNFFKKNIPNEAYIIASETVDAVNEHTDDVINKISKQINRVQTTVENASVYSLDTISKDAGNGDLATIAKKINLQLNVVSLQHPLAPYYKYDYEDGKLISKAAIPEAKKKYPERYTFKGIGHIGDRSFTTSREMENYAYRHQIPIIVDIEYNLSGRLPVAVIT